MFCFLLTLCIFNSYIKWALLLLAFCLLLLPLWESVNVLCFVVRYFTSILVMQLMGKRELDALLNLSPWCLVMAEWLFLAVPWGCLRFVIVVFPDHTHYFSVQIKLMALKFFRFITYRVYVLFEFLENKYSHKMSLDTSTVFQFLFGIFNLNLHVEPDLTRTVCFKLKIYFVNLPTVFKDHSIFISHAPEHVSIK